MNRKPLNLIACTLLVLAMLAPMVSAHNTGGPAIAQPILNPCGIEVSVEDGSPDIPQLDSEEDCAPYVNYVRSGASGGGQVSGRYVGTQGAGIVIDGTNAVFQTTVPGENPIIPDGIAFTTAGAFCDIEVAGSGGGGDPQDETNVDGTDYSGLGNAAPDGTWDDGGQGGACHVTTYDFAGYNTPGCSGTARAEDAISGEGIGILAGCDLLADVTPATDGNANAILVFALCVVNDVLLQGDPTGPPTSSAYTGLANCLNVLLGDGCAIDFSAPGTITACLTGVATTESGEIVTCATNTPAPNCVEVNDCPNVIPTVVTCIVASITPLGCSIVVDVSLVTCLVDGVIRTLYCLLDATPDAVTCGFVPQETQCGQDGFTDQFVFGEGGGRVKAGEDGIEGVVFPGSVQDFPDGDTCAATGGSAVVYTVADVHVTLNDLADEEQAEISVSLPTVGWIDTTATPAAAANAVTVEPAVCVASVQKADGLAANVAAQCQGAFPGAPCGNQAINDGGGNQIGVRVTCTTGAGALLGACINGRLVQASAHVTVGNPGGRVTADILCNNASVLLIGKADTNISNSNTQGGTKTNGKYDCVMEFIWVNPNVAFAGEAYCRDLVAGN